MVVGGLLRNRDIGTSGMPIGTNESVSCGQNIAHIIKEPYTYLYQP